MLTRRQRLQVASQLIVRPLSIVAPVKGWNTRDALDAMDPADAVQLDNFYPDAGGVGVRAGYQSYATGMGSGTVQTLAEYNAGSTRDFLAAANNAIYDVSSSGAVGSPLASGFTNNQWQTVSFNSRLFFMNGADTMQVYDGASLGAATFTGVGLNTLIGGVIYQQRLFFWSANSTGFWYAPLNSISGALAFFDLASFSPHGGNLVVATTFSHDGGAGVTDFIAFMMSSGDCLVYFGNDPAQAVNWQLVGIYRISPPVNIRAVCNYGAESFLTTFDDHVPLHQELVALREGKLPPRSKVSNAVQEAVIANGNAFGWQALYYPRGRRLIFNIPNPDGTFSQHIQNTGTPDKPWCRFINMNASCWGLFNDMLYFGGEDGTVYQADTGTLDNLGAIYAYGQQAWYNFKDPLRKQVTAIAPIVQAIGTLSYNFAIGFDYGAISVQNAVAVANNGSPWDTSPWDTSPWSPEEQINTTWRASGGSGVAIGIALTIDANRPVTWLRTDMRAQRGTQL